MKKPIGAIKLRPHVTIKYKRIAWPVCKYCGLLYLKNEPTRKAIKKGCWVYNDEK